MRRLRPPSRSHPTADGRACRHGGVVLLKMVDAKTGEAWLVWEEVLDHRDLPTRESALPAIVRFDVPPKGVERQTVQPEPGIHGEILIPNLDS